MKSFRLRYAVAAMLLLAACIVYMPTVEGYAVDYKISAVTINADIQPDGSVEVAEFLTYDFSGAANGIFRDIDWLNSKAPRNSASGIDNLTVYEAGLTDDTLDEYKNAPGKNGDRGIYELIKNETGVRIKLYCPADNEQKRFLIQYRLKDAVVRYRDTADLFWKFIGKGWECDLENVNIVITVPQPAESLKIFSHGPSSGNIQLVDSSTVAYHSREIESGHEVSIRVLFPAALVDSAVKTVPENGLATILEQEQKWTKDDQRDRFRFWLSLVLSISWLLICTIVCIVFYRKYGRRPQQFTGTIIEPPSGYGPAFAEYINSFNSVGPNGITAELMNLVKKKYLYVDAASDQLVTNKNKQDLAFSLNNEIHSYEFEHENFLIDWFFHRIGSNGTVTLEQIKTYSKKNSREFNQTFADFKKLIQKEALQQNLLSEKTTAWKPALMLSVFGIGAGIILGVTEQMYEFMASAIAISLILLLLSVLIRRPTKELALEREKWLAYKKHLKEISKAEDNSNYSLAYWENALIFTIVFGYHKNALKHLQTSFADLDFLDPSLTYLHSNAGGGHVLDHVTSTVDSSITNFSSTAGFSSTSGGAGDGGGGGGGGAF